MTWGQSSRKNCRCCGRPLLPGHKNKEFCIKGVDEGNSCRQMAYLKREKRRISVNLRRDLEEHKK